MIRGNLTKRTMVAVKKRQKAARQTKRLLPVCDANHVWTCKCKISGIPPANAQNLSQATQRPEPETRFPRIACFL